MLTIFGVLVTTPTSELPPVITVGLTVLCTVVLAVALMAEYRRERAAIRNAPRAARRAVPVVEQLPRAS